MIKTFGTVLKRLLLTALVSSSILFFSCSKPLCPTYMRPIDKARIIRGIDSPDVKKYGSVPSPYNENYQEKRIGKLIDSSEII